MFYVLQGQPLPVYGDEANVPDWLFVEDKYQGHRAGAQPRAARRDIITSRACERRNLDVIHSLSLLDATFVGTRTRFRFPRVRPRRGSASELITFVRDRPRPQQPVYAVDIPEKARRGLGFEPSNAAKMCRWQRRCSGTSSTRTGGAPSRRGGCGDWVRRQLRSPRRAGSTRGIATSLSTSVVVYRPDLPELLETFRRFDEQGNSLT